MSKWMVTAVALTCAALVLPALPASAVLATDLDQEFLQLLNEARVADGAVPLKVMDELAAGASDQAVRMAEAGYLFHNEDLGSVLADGWAKLGENVGFGYSAPTLHDAFMNSPAHRANVVDVDYEFVGIGTVEEAGTIWVAFVFADMLGSEPSDDAQIPQASQYDGRFFDDDGSVFEAAIETLAAAEVTSGCGEAQFCPDDTVTRGQMAGFLRRAMDVPTGSGDTFSDDDGSVFESDIEALAALGVTSGCGGGLFCPDDTVTRGQMAGFLVRAKELPAGSGDTFSDDDGSLFESDIEALAEAGVTTGCAVGRFCPDEPVTRGQMAAFLVTAFGL